MRSLRFTCVALLLAAVAGVTAPPARAAVGVAVNASVGGPIGVDTFYSHLAPYGHWVERPSYGWVFLPANRHAGWRPYTVGRWAYTDYGWTWVSGDAEPWGWAAYHYGRWYDDPDYGWGWVPGTDWGPAWVSWQEGGGYLGWAALPPAVGWNAGAGLELGGFNLSVGIAPASWCFVPQRSFLAANVGGFLVGGGRNVEILRSTRNITNYSVVDHHAFNRSLQVADVERATGQRVRPLRVANLNEARGARINGATLAMYHPAVVRRDGARTPRELAPRSVIHSPAERRDLAAQARRPAAPTHAAALAAAHHAPPAAVHHDRPAAPAVHERRAPAAVHERRPAPVAAGHRPPAVAEHRAVTHAPTHHNPPPTAHRGQAAPAEHHNPPPAEHRAPATVHHSAPPPEHHTAAATEHHAPPPPARTAQPRAAEHHAGPPPAAHAESHGAPHPQPPPKPEHQGGGEHRDGN